MCVLARVRACVYPFKRPRDSLIIIMHGILKLTCTVIITIMLAERTECWRHARPQQVTATPTLQTDAAASRERHRQSGKEIACLPHCNHDCLAPYIHRSWARGHLVVLYLRGPTHKRLIINIVKIVFDCFTSTIVANKYHHCLCTCVCVYIFIWVFYICAHVFVWLYTNMCFVCVSARARVCVLQTSCAIWRYSVVRGWTGRYGVLPRGHPVPRL